MRTHRLSMLLGAVVVVVAAVSGGCGGGSKSKPASASTSASSGGTVIKTVTVHETEYKLNPSTITLAKPGTYVFMGVNDGTVTHALEVEGKGIEEETGDISPGKSASVKVTLSQTGTYEIYCPVDGHKEQGMEGKIAFGPSTGSTGDTQMDESTGTTDTTQTPTRPGY